jgi:translation initiation factor 6 (eIF-6)
VKPKVIKHNAIWSFLFDQFLKVNIIIQGLRSSVNHKVHVKKPSWDAMGNIILMNDYETIIQLLGHE